jgi:hypothetical protein
MSEADIGSRAHARIPEEKNAIIIQRYHNESRMEKIQQPGNESGERIIGVKRTHHTARTLHER